MNVKEKKMIKEFLTIFISNIKKFTEEIDWHVDWYVLKTSAFKKFADKYFPNKDINIQDILTNIVSNYKDICQMYGINLDSDGDISYNNKHVLISPDA
jgi:hypothetical protein